MRFLGSVEADELLWLIIAVAPLKSLSCGFVANVLASKVFCMVLCPHHVNAMSPFVPSRLARS